MVFSVRETLLGFKYSYYLPLCEKSEKNKWPIYEKNVELTDWQTDRKTDRQTMVIL